MESILISAALAFIEGFALILSPCILPILPILLSAGIEGERARPIGIITGFALFFALITFFSHALVQYYGLNLDLIRQISFVSIALFGAVLVSDKLSEKFSLATQGVAKLGNQLSQTKQAGFGSGVLLGALVSLIWVPCGGPILAAAIVQTAIQKTSWLSFIIFLCFALGSVIPMIILSLVGKKILTHLGFLKNKAPVLRKIFGIIIIGGSAFAAFYTPDPDFAPLPLAPNVVVATLSDHSPLINALTYPYPAPSIQNAGAWINSTPLDLKQLKGKVILIDFWTYSCINCVRTLPYIKSWYAKYKKDGLVVIGVHTPEFGFEKNLVNVTNAVRKYGIQYPVVLDNNYQIWSNYQNSYWPAHYLINKNGDVVYQHFGEGQYVETEHNIRKLLGLSDTTHALTNQNTPLKFQANQTPETYLGYARASFSFVLKNFLHDQNSSYLYPKKLPLNQWALQGAWKLSSQYIETTANNAAIKIHFRAAKIYLVGGSINGEKIPVRVSLNHKALAKDAAGADLDNGMLYLSDKALYQVLNLAGPQEGTLELNISSPGAQLYSFTFGS